MNDRKVICLCAKISEVNLSVFIYRLFHKDFLLNRRNKHSLGSSVYRYGWLGSSG